jgi:hypothetical protein
MMIVAREGKREVTYLIHSWVGLEDQMTNKARELL